MQKNTRVTT